MKGRRVELLFRGASYLSVVGAVLRLSTDESLNVAVLELPGQRATFLIWGFLVAVGALGASLSLILRTVEMERAFLLLATLGVLVYGISGLTFDVPGATRASPGNFFVVSAGLLYLALYFRLSREIEERETLQGALEAIVDTRTKLDGRDEEE